jgi:hypothetical protein
MPDDSVAASTTTSDARKNELSVNDGLAIGRVMQVGTVRGLRKLWRTAADVRALQNGTHWHDGAPLGIVLDTMWYDALIASFVIQLISLFDDALEAYIVENGLQCPKGRFWNRVE